MGDPLAFFITWTTYGSWLPGDSRGWVDKHNSQLQSPDPIKQNAARTRMKESAVLLNSQYRKIVKNTIEQVCHFKNWKIHALCVYTNHIHIVISADNIHPKQIMQTLKAYCSRRLNESIPSPRKHWWTRLGSTRYINTKTSLNNTIEYVQNQILTE